MEQNKVITLADYQALYARFQQYIKTAEPHEFPYLRTLDMMFQRIFPRWREPLNQDEAQSVFHAIEQYISKEEKNQCP